MECLDDDTISNYVEGTLAAAEVADVNRHARDCERCRRLIGTLLASPARTVTAPTSDVQRLMHALAQPSEPGRIGQVLAGKYRLERELGSGGMGVVYAAENSWTRRQVALKVLRPQLSKDPEVVRRFMREARAASRIRHPNVVDILDLGQDADGSLFMVQEFLVGRTLRQRLDAEGPLGEHELRRLLLPILDALAAAHAQGIVHRDVKPENIFLAEQPGAPQKSGPTIVPTLIDFGISKRAAPDSLGETGPDRPIGTPVYMSPEQLRAKDDLDGRSDVWAMGVVMFEALAGQRPFEAANPSEVIARVLTKRAPALTTLVPTISPALAALVARALEPDRERRIAGAQAMATELRRLQLRSPRRARRGTMIAVSIALSIALAVAAAALLLSR